MEMDCKIIFSLICNPFFQGAFPHNSMNNGPPNQFHGHPGPMGPGDFPPHGFQPNMQPGPGKTFFSLNKGKEK